MESLKPHSSNPSSDIKINSVRRRAVRRARDITTTLIAKTAYSTAHTGLRVLGMPPPSSRSEVSIESDLVEIADTTVTLVLKESTAL